MSVDLAQAQGKAVDAIAVWLHAQFFHAAQAARRATGQPWPEDCPSPGGWHGGPKEMREGAPEGVRTTWFLSRLPSRQAVSFPLDTDYW